MSSQTCSHVMNCGDRRGAPCGNPVVKDGLCDPCNVRQEATLILQTTTGRPDVMCTHNLDPYGSGECERPAVYKGYCFLCLARW